MVLIQLMETEKIVEGASTSSYSVCAEILFWKGVLAVALHSQVTTTLWWFVLVTARNNLKITTTKIKKTET